MKELLQHISTKIVEHIYTYSGQTLMWVTFALGVLVSIGLFFLLRAGIRQFRHHLNDAMKAIMVRTYISFAGLFALMAMVVSLPWSRLPDNIPWEVWLSAIIFIPGILYVLWLRHVWGYKVLDWKKNDVLEEGEGKVTAVLAFPREKAPAN